jgi:tape measure domain-containing protein
MALKNLLVKVGVSTKGLNSSLRRAKNDFRREFGEIQSMTANVGRSMTSALTVPLLGIGAAAVKSAADLEKMETSFISLTGGAKQAADMMANLNEFTAKTPFQIEGVANAARQLIASGTEVSQVNDQLQFLGDIAATSGVSIEEIAAIFAKVNAKGKVELENLNQLAERGIPIFKALADATGLPADELGAGAVSVEEFNRTLSGFAKEGGFAAGAMERLSETAAGKFSTALDNLKLAGAELAKSLMPALKDILDGIVKLAQRFTGLSDETKKNVLIFAAMTAAAGPLVMFASQMMNIIPMIKLMRTAMIALNTTMLANPLLAVAAGVTALAGVMLTLKANTKTAKDETLEFIQSIAGIDKQQQILQLNQRKRELEEEKAVIERAKRLSEAQAKVGSLGDKFDKQIQTFNAAEYTEQVDGITDAITELNKAIATATYGDGAVITLPTVDAGAGGGAGAGAGGGGGDMARAQEEMVEMTTKQATAIENVGAAATATLQPMTDWTQVVADEQNLEAGQRFNEMLYNMQQAALELAKTIGAQLGGAFADMITGAKKSGEAFKGFAKEAIKAALAASQAHIIEAAISSGKMSGPLAMFVIPGLIAAGMGIVDAAFGDVAAFAAGGLVTGPVLGLVGEGPGTSRMNPEVIAPLDKLQSMMGGSQVQVTGMLRGADILLTNERAQIDRNRLRSF